jgi:hypothetical protein
MLISNQSFIQPNPPTLHPHSMEYLVFWREEKRRCMEGYWVGGKWMPGILYFFVNHWHIELNKKATSKVKTIARPFLRDLEWERGFIFSEARGFSGFQFDEEESCHRILKEDDIKLAIDELDEETRDEIVPSITKKDGSYKKYVPAREYLRRVHNKTLGKPLYLNYALNVVDIESRGTGKSFWMSVVVAWNFLFDGSTDYDHYREEPTKSETMVGAIDSFYSKALIKKVILGLDNLMGSTEINGTYFTSPLSKTHKGSWESNKSIIALYDEKIGGSWVTKGSGSQILHKTFADNPHAGNGTRPGVVVLEEIGFFGNLLAALGQLKECTVNGSAKFGTIWMSGTGGDMDGGSTEAVKEVFYDPAKYDCLEFPDLWEGSPRSIGMFVPAWMGLNQYKDKEGNTNKDAALGYLQRERKKLMDANSKAPLNSELQQRPIKPSEAFLITSGNIFDIAEIKRQIAFLETTTDGFAKGLYGEMVINNTGHVEFDNDVSNKLRPTSYPTKEGDDTHGCWVVWEQPIKNAPYGLYVAGTDPYNQDQAVNSDSLGSTFIMMRAMPGYNNHDRIVAEYTARPKFAKDYHEQVRRGLQYYNALCLYENMFNAMKTHFEHRQSLHLLAYTPTVLKSNSNTTISRVYGQNMSKNVKVELEIMLRDWLNEECDEGRINIHNIYSIPLLKELESYNEIGNFDRVIAMMMVVCQRTQMHRIIAKKVEEEKRDSFWTRTFY